jgi:hypothetical protein
MTLHSYKLIAVEYGGKEREMEQQGHSQGDAARRLGLSDSHLIRVLNGNPEARGENNPYRKVCWFRQGYAPEATEMGQALMAARADTAKMVLDQLAGRGIKLIVINDVEDGIARETIGVRPPGDPTAEDLAEIEAHKDSLIALLKERAAARAAQQSSPEPNTKNSRPNTQRSILAGLVPELPQPSFLRYDLERILHKHGHHELADNTTALDNLLSDFTRRKVFERIKPGCYRVKASAAASSTSSETPQPLPPPQTPPPSDEAANDEQASSPPASKPEPGLQETLIGLAAQMSAGTVDESTIQAVEQAVNNLEIDFFAIIEKVVDPIRTLTQQLRTMNAIRAQFLAHLTPPKN